MSIGDGNDIHTFAFDRFSLITVVPDLISFHRGLGLWRFLLVSLTALHVFKAIIIS